MTQRIILDDTINQVESDIIHEFNTRDSFKLAYKFTQLNPHVPVDLRSFNLTASFWIYGRENKIITYDKQDEFNQNIIIDQFHQTIRFIFNDHGFETGRLYQSLVFKYPDMTIPGNFIVDEVKGFTGIILI